MPSDNEQLAAAASAWSSQPSRKRRRYGKSIDANAKPLVVASYAYLGHRSPLLSCHNITACATVCTTGVAFPRRPGPDRLGTSSQVCIRVPCLPAAPCPRTTSSSPTGPILAQGCPSCPSTAAATLHCARNPHSAASIPASSPIHPTAYPTSNAIPPPPPTCRALPVSHTPPPPAPTPSARTRQQRRRLMGPLPIPQRAARPNAVARVTS